jgi:hypothetical protein
VEGFISDFASATQFNIRVGSLVIAVTTTDGTVYEGGSAADLGNNLKVEVEGDLNSSNELQATKIEIKTSTNVRVTGQVDAVSTADETITILNITVNTATTSTQFEDKSSALSESATTSRRAARNSPRARSRRFASNVTTSIRPRTTPNSAVSWKRAASCASRGSLSWT